MSGAGSRKVSRRCSMKTAVGQNGQPECESLRNSQPMEFTKQWGYAFWPPRWENQTGGGIQLRTAAGLAAGRGYQREPSCSSPPCWQSVHEPRSARHVVTKITARSGSDVEPRITLWRRRLWRGSSWTCQRRCRPRGRGSKKLAARQWCQCGPDQTVSDVVDEKMCTRELQSWRDSAAADGMPSKPKPHRHRRNSSSRRRRKRSGIAGAGLSLIWPPHFTVTL